MYRCVIRVYESLSEGGGKVILYSFPHHDSRSNSTASLKCPGSVYGWQVKMSWGSVLLNT